MSDSAGWFGPLRHAVRSAHQQAEDIGLTPPHAATFEVGYVRGFRDALALPRVDPTRAALERLGIRVDVLLTAYNWIVATDGALYGLTAGDMGYEPSGITVDVDTEHP
jgi:hypothetical protein